MACSRFREARRPFFNSSRLGLTIDGPGPVEANRRLRVDVKTLREETRTGRRSPVAIVMLRKCFKSYPEGMALIVRTGYFSHSRPCLRWCFSIQPCKAVWHRCMTRRSVVLSSESRTDPFEPTSEDTRTSCVCEWFCRRRRWANEF